MMRLALALALLCLIPALPARADPGRLAQLVDYVGVDYAAAVDDGAIVDAFEYQEMQEFAGLIGAEVRGLAPGEARQRLLPLATELHAAIQARAAPAEVSAIAGRMTDVLLASGMLAGAPEGVPDLAAAEQLYLQQCAGCHGAAGRGDGAAASAGMEPSPTDFTDAERARARSLYGLFNTITLGVDGTAMPAFRQLSDAERWALAFYVGGLYADADSLHAGQQVFEKTPASQLPTMRELTTTTPAALAAQDAAAADLYAWLRRNPAALAEAGGEPLVRAMAGVRRSLSLYADGSAQAAHAAAVDAYLEGFELAEAALQTTQPQLVREVESAMTGLRLAMRNHRPLDEVQAAGGDALRLLQAARDTQTGASLSPGVSFVSAFVILLREGLEAILVLGAIAAFLGKTERRDALAWLHGGWIAALAAGALTWAVSTYFISISGATRELTEGLTALIASAVLFYVGFWMHGKLAAQRWQHFIRDSVQKALDGRALWAVAGISFIAVYREVFETVLFFQALSAQITVRAAQSAMAAGTVAGAVVLVGLSWAIFRFGVRLPLRQFFGATAAVMIALSVIFAGKGVAALQEAGKLPLDPVAFPRIELLGIYPTLQSLGIQLAVLVAALALLAYGARPSLRVRAGSGG